MNTIRLPAPERLRITNVSAPNWTIYFSTRFLSSIALAMYFGQVEVINDEPTIGWQVFKLQADPVYDFEHVVDILTKWGDGWPLSMNQGEVQIDLLQQQASKLVDHDLRFSKLGLDKL